jgi:triosephosphate isomerase (TIM)
MLVAGNWKMHGLAADLGEIETIAAQASRYPEVDVALCLPAILIERAVRAVPNFPIGAQDVHQLERGAHTGCTSAEMLRDAGARLTIVGHSERRDAQRESDAEIKAKAEAALAAELGVILCVGESLEAREHGRAITTVLSQLEGSLPDQNRINASLAIAYEPIWAIGTGKVATSVEIAEMHLAIHDFLVGRLDCDGGAPRVVYGGSVKPSNAGEIFAVEHVDGALVGGASLKSADFIPIVAEAARAHSREAQSHSV